jgi:uncharacterized protein
MTYPPPPPEPREPAGGPSAYQGSPVTGEERSMMLLAHLSAPVAFFISAGVLPFLGPLLIWLFYKDRSAAVRTASAGAFNFNLSMTIATWLTWASVLITLGVGLIWAIPILIVLFGVQVWAHVRGVLRALDGRTYRYPLQIPVLS